MEAEAEAANFQNLEAEAVNFLNLEAEAVKNSLCPDTAHNY